MDREAMIEIAEAVIARQDVGDPDGIASRFAPACTFMMPILQEPIRGRAALRDHAAGWPKAVTDVEWSVVEGDRLVCAWNWRGDGWPPETPLLRGVSTFVFDADGLIAEYEDFFDPDWTGRHASG